MAKFADGHIDGAVMIDFYADSFADDIAALDPDATYLVYCRSGNRSGQTTALMAEDRLPSVPFLKPTVMDRPLAISR